MDTFLQNLALVLIKSDTQFIWLVSTVIRHAYVGLATKLVLQISGIAVTCTKKETKIEYIANFWVVCIVQAW